MLHLNLNIWRFTGYQSRIQNRSSGLRDRNDAALCALQIDVIFGLGFTTVGHTDLLKTM
jgi:hypothetical protein